jgi:hypothetical protein
VTEILSATAEVTVSIVHAEMERLEVLTKRFTMAVDEFGRSRRHVNVCIEGDVYESPETDATKRPIDKTVDEGKGNGTGSDPRAQVGDEFKSLSSIAGRFVEWKSR